VIALQYRKEHALGSTEYSDLSNKALKYYEEEKDKDAINSVLEYASLPEQISYLKRKDDMQNDLIALYKKHNMTRELARLYKEKHEFIEAAKVAGTIEDKTALLIQAFKEFTLQPIEAVGKELSEMFSEIINKMDNNIIDSIKSEAYYCYTRLTINTKYMTNAIRLLYLHNDHLGQLICFKLLLRLDLVNRNGCFRNMVESYKKLEVLIRSVFSLVDDLTKENVEKDWINTSLEKLGYRRVDRKEYRIEDHSSYKFYLNLAKLDHSKSMIQANHKISKPQAKTMAVKVFLSLLQDLIKSFRELVAQQVVSSTVCQVSGKCSDNTCKKLHQCPTLDSFSNGINSLFSSIAISGFCIDAMQSLSTLYAESTKWLELSSTDLYHLHTLLHTHKPFLHIIKSEALLSLFNIHYKSKKVLIDIMRREWEEKVFKRKIDMDSYNGMSFISYLLDKSRPVINELRASKMKKYYPFDLFNMFNNRLESLYFYFHVRKFFTTTIKLLNRCSTLVSVDTFCDMLEVPVLLLFSCISATSSLRRRYPFVIPYSYTQQRDLWDSMYSQGSGFSKAIARLERTQHCWKTFASYVEEICKIFVNANGVFQKLEELFMKQDANKVHLTIPISRLLCLYLVLLANLQQGLDDFGKPLMIVKLFREPLQVKSQSFLTKIFRQIGQLNDWNDAKKVLAELLKSRKDFLQQYDWNISKQRLVIISGAVSPIATDQHFKKILKRGEDFTPKERKEVEEEEIKKEIVDEEDDEYYRKGRDEEEQEIEDQASLHQRELRQQDDRERALANKVKEKWYLLVHRKRVRRVEVVENCKKMLFGLRIKYWLMRRYRSNGLDSSLSDQEPEEYDERHFNVIGQCCLCQIPDAQNRMHLKSELHISNVELFEKHTATVEEYDQTRETYISLDFQDNEIDMLITRYNTEIRFLEWNVRMPFPYSEKLQIIVDRFTEKCNILGKYQVLVRTR